MTNNAKNEKLTADQIEDFFMELYNRKVWIPDGKGGYEEAFVNSVVLRTRSKKNNHPACCEIIETASDLVKFTKP